jgi:hypothetical protein
VGSGNCALDRGRVIRRAVACRDTPPRR